MPSSSCRGPRVLLPLLLCFDVALTLCAYCLWGPCHRGSGIIPSTAINARLTYRRDALGKSPTGPGFEPIVVVAHVDYVNPTTVSFMSPRLEVASGKVHLPPSPVPLVLGAAYDTVFCGWTTCMGLVLFFCVLLPDHGFPIFSRCAACAPGAVHRHR